ncbi:hypothetical protein KFE25_008265 [Diacronema lutheri]|uniref:DUF985 domain-containing protein n=1 Tax=Diacronema lutheri TaxID=2081491 RepID=A0A8J5XDT7_DIALT|nr:hypothetical protein KFE25_008265 [Diacronema lutheri]
MPSPTSNLHLAIAAACGALAATIALRALASRAASGRALASSNDCAASIAQKLGLIPHPEGGFFLETFRAGAPPMASRGQTDTTGTLVATLAREGGQRNTLTSIYYMLTAESPKQWWANNISDHVHYWHGGGEVTYRVVGRDGVLSTHTLGPACPQLVVRGGSFKCAQLAAGAKYTLLGEAVAPGFDFRDFQFVSQQELDALVPEQARMLASWVKEQPESQFDEYYGEGASSFRTAGDGSLRASSLHSVS